MLGYLTVEATLLPQEANFSVGIAPDQTDNDSLLFPALEPIDAAQLDAGKCLFQRGEDCELDFSSGDPTHQRFHLMSGGKGGRNHGNVPGRMNASIISMRLR